METDISKREILAWLEEEDLPNARKDDQFILRFLQGCKYNTDRAKEKMKNYLQMRRTTPEWFDQRDPTLKPMTEVLDLGMFLPLPVADDKGRCVVIVRAAINNTRINPMEDVFKAGMMVGDLLLEIKESAVADGVVIIIDLQGVGMGHALQMTPSLIRRAVHSWQDCYPIRLKSIDFVNCPSYISIVVNVFKQFMREKLKKRIRIHKSLTSLLQSFDRKCLPPEYGGTSESVASIAREWKIKTQSRKQWFLDDVTIKGQT